MLSPKRVSKAISHARWSRTKLHETSLSVLLALQVITLFVVSPVVSNNGTSYSWMIDACIALMAFISVFAVKDGLRRRLIVCSLALCISGFACDPFIGDYKTSAILLCMSGIAFSGIISWTVGHKLFADGPITLHRIRGAIVIYLNIATAFASLDNLLVYVLPNAYSNISPEVKNNIGTMIYFSLTTLTTTGYGDIVPIHPYARSLASLESVIGQFYLTTLIGVLVGLHVYHRNNMHNKK